MRLLLQRVALAAGAICPLPGLHFLCIRTICHPVPPTHTLTAGCTHTRPPPPALVIGGDALACLLPTPHHWLPAPNAHPPALCLLTVCVLGASRRRCTPLHTASMRLRHSLSPTRPPGVVNHRLLAPHVLPRCPCPIRVVHVLCGTACSPSTSTPPASLLGARPLSRTRNPTFFS
ncbi:hypothetical protein C8J57DRAFT_1517467 [Mycena rebaudengoi]|nr:hypothetical protein C8J57DRAFT_1517467 [Mycena rebaudengoi]